MAPLKPHWQQPSHPAIQEVVVGHDADFSSKSLSRITLAPFGVYADLSFPPCTLVPESTYATVQVAEDKHIMLNSDLLYLNHSCEPSLIIDTDNMQILASERGLKPGDELTFFYPSTEWHMAQPFTCACDKPSCRGRISGAEDMSASQLEGYWLSGHIRRLKRRQQQQQQQQQQAVDGVPGSAMAPPAAAAAAAAVLRPGDPTVQALQDALNHAEKVVDAAKRALGSYVELSAAVGNAR